MARLPERQIVAIEQLHPAAYNPRKDLKRGDPEYDHLANSIEAFGYIEPIVWNKRSGNVVGGHQRLKVLIERGETEAEVVVVDYDETTEQAANLALNKIRGDWDFPKLADLLISLDTGAFDLDLTGFSEGELKNIMGWTPGGNDPAAEWQGMPECENEDLLAKISIKVNFKSDDDLREFEEVVGQKVPMNIKSIWYPAVQRAPTVNQRWTDES
jgi:hypothetical protein